MKLKHFIAAAATALLMQGANAQERIDIVNRFGTELSLNLNIRLFA